MVSVAGQAHTRARDAGPVREAARPVRDAPAAAFGHGFDVALNPATIGALVNDADAGTRERLIATLQRLHGNAAVQRLIPQGGTPVQRWAVTLAAGTTDCATVVNFLNTNSPHRASSGWAKTFVRFNWGGSPAYTESEGVITATVSSPTVTPSVRVDMPVWAPTNAAMATAWSAMTANLRAHEAEHEAIATTWETTLRTNLSELSVTVPNRTLAAFNAAVQAEWDGWLAQHQADQNAIDPYTALLDCSAGASEEAEGTAGGEGGAGEGFDLTALEEEPELGGS